MSIKTAMRYHLTLLRIAILLRFISSYEDETLRRPRGTGTPTLGLSSVQFSRSVVSDSFDPMNRSTPGLPVHHQLPESTQSHVHRVGDAIQASHSLSSPSPPALNLSQHQGLFQWVSSLRQVAKVLELQLQHQSFQWIFRTDFLQDELVGSPCCPRDSRESCPTPLWAGM